MKFGRDEKPFLITLKLLFSPTFLLHVWAFPQINAFSGGANGVEPFEKLALGGRDCYSGVRIKGEGAGAEGGVALPEGYFDLERVSGAEGVVCGLGMRLQSNCGVSICWLEPAGRGATFFAHVTLYYEYNLRERNCQDQQ